MGKNKLINQEKIVDVCKLPKDIVLGASIINILGNQEIWIENYKGILEYNENKLLLQGKKNQILVRGKNLKITYYTKEDMKVCGHISEISYQ